MYAWPGGPNTTLLRAVRPAAAWAARSSAPRYASTSTMRPARTFRPWRRTMSLPKSSRLASRGSRLKNARRSSFQLVCAALGGITFFCGDPVVNVPFQNIQRQRAGAEDHVMERLQVESISQFFVGAGAQLFNLQLAGLVRQRLSG